MESGNRVRWTNQITGQYEYGVLRFAYETKWGTHWMVKRNGDSVGLPERRLEVVEESAVG